MESYRPGLLPPICGKIFERLIFNELFKPGNSCINHVLSKTHEMCNSFDEGQEVRSAFLDISKASGKVWYKGLLFILLQNELSGNLLCLLLSFLNDRKKIVVLNGQTYWWRNTTAEVPQDPIWGPLLFLIYIHDLSDNLFSKEKLFAGDTSLFSVIHNSTVIQTKLVIGFFSRK